jgi:hypothetical protein
MRTTYRTSRFQPIQWSWKLDQAASQTAGSARSAAQSAGLPPNGHAATPTARYALRWAEGQAYPTDGIAAMLRVGGGVHADVGVPDEVDVIHRDQYQPPLHVCQVQELAVPAEGLQAATTDNMTISIAMATAIQRVRLAVDGGQMCCTLELRRARLPWQPGLPLVGLVLLAAFQR